jgi:protein-disulfide isomerase
MGVTGTPTIYLDGIRLDMSLFRDIDGFKTFIEGRLK